MNVEGLLGKNIDIQEDKRLASEIYFTFISVFHNMLFLLPPVPSIFYFKLFTNSLCFMFSPWLISSLATASFVMYSEVLSKLVAHTQISTG